MLSGNQADGTGRKASLQNYLVRKILRLEITPYSFMQKSSRRFMHLPAYSDEIGFS